MAGKSIVMLVVAIFGVSAIWLSATRYSVTVRDDVVIRFDHWTGGIEACTGAGCRSIDGPYKPPAIAAATPAPTSEPTINIETPLGVNLIFRAGTSKQVIEQTVARLDGCGAKAKTRSAFERCYRPSVSEQANGALYSVNGSAIIPTEQLEF